MRRPLRALAFLILAGFPLIAVLAADIPVVPYAEQKLEEAAAGWIQSESVEVHLEGFPVVARALVKGEVVQVDYRWATPMLGRVRAHSLQIYLRGVALARPDLLNGEARIEGVEAGELAAEIPLAEISRLLDRDVRIHEGELMVSITPASEVVGSVSASANGLVLTAGPLEPIVADFDDGVMPCAPRVTLEDSVFLLRCEFRGLPPLLRP